VKYVDTFGHSTVKILDTFGHDTVMFIDTFGLPTVKFFDTVDISTVKILDTFGHPTVKFIDTVGQLTVNIPSSLPIPSYIFERIAVNCLETFCAFYGGYYGYILGRFTVNYLDLICLGARRKYYRYFLGRFAVCYLVSLSDATPSVISIFCRISHSKFSRRFAVRLTVRYSDILSAV